MPSPPAGQAAVLGGAAVGGSVAAATAHAGHRIVLIDA